MPSNPLAEVFGYRTDDFSLAAKKSREKRSCPFNHRSSECHKSSASNPIGVCSIIANGKPVITCPYRFEENWLFAKNAASFFKSGTRWEILTEVKLKDSLGKSAGNIDYVIATHDSDNKILDFGSVEVQSVYITGNVRNPFSHYMTNPKSNKHMEWPSKGYPKPDYLSSSRKRLLPQLLIKGGILKAWGKKQAVALQTEFFETLPTIATVASEKADIAWLLYDLTINKETNRFQLSQNKVVYTEFASALERISTAAAGNESVFIELLERKLTKKLKESQST